MIINQEKIKEETEDPEDELNEYMDILKDSLNVERIKKKERLILEFKKEIKSLTPLVEASKPALSYTSKSDITDSQIRNVKEFQIEIEKRKKYTDGGDDIEKKKITTL